VARNCLLKCESSPGPVCAHLVEAKRSKTHSHVWLYRMRRLASLERALAILGGLLLTIYLGARIHGAILSRAEVQRFRSQSVSARQEPPGAALAAGTPDFSLWSEKRIQEYQASLTVHLAPATAILRIPKIRLEVPVLEGTDDLSLNRGVGLIAGTARPGADGNIGIAGHRDGFFRGLKDLVAGDTIEIEAKGETSTYKIDRMVIVEPADISVLAPQDHPSLTLVTCYPFYFVGSAPQRYIVQASRVESSYRQSVDSSSRLQSKQIDAQGTIK